MSVGGVLDEAWNLYKRFFWRFVGTAFVVFAALDLLTALADRAGHSGRSSAVLWALASLVIGVIGYFWVQAALVATVEDVRDGRADRSISETYGAVRPRLASAIFAGLLAGLGIAIGFVLLIVPGLYLLTIWSMVIPVVVLEGRTVGDALARSHDVVRGRGWTVFGIIVVTFVLIAIASAIIHALFSPLPNFLGSWLGSLVADSLTVPFAAAALTAAYFQLVRQDEPLAEPTTAP